MKKLISILVISTLVFLSCDNRKYRYEIHSKVYVPTSGVSGLHDAIWFTDTISFDRDTIYYFNSDGSEVRIKPPYVLINHVQ